MIRRAFAEGTRDSTGRPGRNYWQTWMDYTIAARLDAETSTLSGRETIKLHNASDSALSSIQMRLDQNIFRGDVPRGASVPAENTEGFVITKLAFNGRPVDLNAPAFGRGGRGGRGGGAAPTEPVAVGIHTTSARIVLPSPIAPKSDATLDVEWHYKLAGGPGQGHRMTFRWGDTLYQVAQWYPRVAVYDDLRGWDTDPYLGPSEFYNNFGRFDVSLDLPAGWIVGATGVLENPDQVLTPAARERLAHVLESDSTRTIVGPTEIGPGQATAAGDRLIWHFVADTVNDFAWATAKQFVWQATRATIPGRGAIPVNFYYLPGHAASYADAGRILRHALEFYSKLWMSDPFPQHTMVDGPDNGMEYPMLVMSNDGPADHETGHQWWPMTVSGNETWYGWMDEGFNQYMNILSAADNEHRAAQSRRVRTILRPHERRRTRGAADVGRQLRRSAVFLPGLQQDAAHALHARRDRRRHRGLARAQRIREGVALQAPVALGLRVLHEQRAPQGPRLVLVLLAVHHRVGRRIDSARDDERFAHDRDRSPGRADARPRGSQGRVRARVPARFTR